MTAAMPGLLRRLAAIAYDSLIVGALLIAATALTLPFNAGEAIPAGTLWFQLYLSSVAVVYFAGSWRRGGQTIGMMPWRLRLVATAGGRPSLSRCVVRAIAAPFSWLALGAGFLWILVDERRRGWHDLISGTELALDEGASARAPARQP